MRVEEKKIRAVGITFTSAQIADIPASAMRAAEWETEAYWTRRIGAYLPKEGQQDRTILVAEDGTTLVGFVAGHRTRRFGCDGELEWINVGRESQGRGVEAMLVREIGLLRRPAFHGSRAGSLAAGKMSPLALRQFVSCGFQSNPKQA